MNAVAGPCYPPFWLSADGPLHHVRGGPGECGHTMTKAAQEPTAATVAFHISRLQTPIAVMFRNRAPGHNQILITGSPAPLTASGI